MILNCFALLVVALAAAVNGHGAGFKIRAIAQVPNGAATITGSPQLNLSSHVAPGERLVMSRGMQVDEAGAVYLNFDRISRTGWKELPAEEAFKDGAGREPTSAEELAGWRSYFEKNRPQTDAAKQEAWEEYLRGVRQMHPGFAPTEKLRPLSIKIDADGNVLEIVESPISISRSGLVETVSISAQDLQWFKNNVQLPELKDKKEKIEWRDREQRKSVVRLAEFSEGLNLGSDKSGNTVFLMTIAMPFHRPHNHGTSDFISRVYVLDKARKVRHFEAAYPTIRMHATTGDLYELYEGPYEGLMPALDDSKVKPVVVRVWKAR